MSENRHIEHVVSQAKQLSGEALTEFFSRLAEAERQAVAGKMSDENRDVEETNEFESDGERLNEVPPNRGPKKADSLVKKPGLKRVGNFKILQAIGQGGMGQVFLAEQTHPVKRRVALKVIKTDSPSEEILARFEAERQALALETVSRFGIVVRRMRPRPDCSSIPIGGMAWLLCQTLATPILARSRQLFTKRCSNLSRQFLPRLFKAKDALQSVCDLLDKKSIQNVSVGARGDTRAPAYTMVDLERMAGTLRGTMPSDMLQMQYLDVV